MITIQDGLTKPESTSDKKPFMGSLELMQLIAQTKQSPSSDSNKYSYD